jgi:predicted AlkP superfamily phosphohydrolase/phosphomutase
MVSGWLTPFTAKDFTYPTGLFQELLDKVGEYHIYPQDTFRETHRDEYLAASRHFLERTLKANLYLMRREPWDFYMTVVFDTDRVLHQMWHYLDPSHPWRTDKTDLSSFVLEYFKQVDDAVGQMVHEAGDDTLTFLMSDHGMGSAHYFIILNIWLLQEGLLVLKSDALTRFKQALFNLGFHLVNIHRLTDRLGLSKHAEYRAGYFTDSFLKQIFLSFQDVDWSRSKAYSYGRHYGNIYLNVKGREPQGIIEPGAEYEAVRADIAERARRFSHPYTKQPVVEDVLTYEELYHGPRTDEAPDLTLVPRDFRDIFFGLSDFGINVSAQPVYRYSGMHRPNGLLVARGPGIRSSVIQRAEIVDLAPTILYAMGIPVPRDMDGKVLTDLFESGNGWGSVEYTDEIASSERVPELVYTAAQEEQVKNRLKGMGYLGS